MHSVKTQWKGKMAFDSDIDDHSIRMDTIPLIGDNTGPGPKKLLLSALAGCTGMDVVSLLKKMRIPIAGFEMNIEADLSTEHPKVYTEIRLVYRFMGSELNREKIKKAVTLSQNKYCGVSAMLKKNCSIQYHIEWAESL